jgi:hypothetical protein
VSRHASLNLRLPLPAPVDAENWPSFQQAQVSILCWCIELPVMASRTHASSGEGSRATECHLRRNDAVNRFSINRSFNLFQRLASQTVRSIKWRPADHALTLAP